MSPQPASQPIVIDQVDAESYLEGLSISLPDILDGLTDAYDAASNRDDSYWPTTARGLELWAQLVHHVRQSLDASDAWTVKNPHNRPVMIGESGNYEFAVARGDSGTGKLDTIPNLARAAGTETTHSANRFSAHEQLTLITLSEIKKASESDTSKYPVGTWFLLYRSDNGIIRSEISLPAHISTDGFVESWHVRVLLPDIDDFVTGDRKPLPTTLDDDIAFNIA